MPEQSKEAEDILRCSFCYNQQDAVDFLISSPLHDQISRAYICNECVAVCASILEDNGYRQPSRVNAEDPVDSPGPKGDAGPARPTVLPISPSVEGLTAFYSYSHRDESLRNKLDEHLSILRYQGLIRGWHDRKIVAGQTWETEIDREIEHADIVLLLVSSSFLSSDYCYGRELTRALERHAKGECEVIPIILKPADWSHSPMAKLQALPRDGKAVTTWSNREQAFLNISQGIRKAVMLLRERRK